MNGLILVFLLCVVNHVVGEGIYVIKGDQVKFPATGNCKKEGATLVHRLKDDSTPVVAYWDDGWKPGPGYGDRMSPNESVIFYSANINDGGVYELTCSHESTQLHVALSTNSSVTEGDTVTFPFFRMTAGTPGTFTVERDGKLVFKLDCLTGHVTNGTGFEGRVSVSPQWKSQGDLTVTLKGATTGDRGDYFLLYDQDKGPREAVRLRVSERVPDQTTSSPPPVTPTQNVTNETQKRTWIAVCITAAVVFIITAPVCVLIGWFLKTRCSRGTPEPVNAPSSDVGAALLNGGPPRGPPEADEGPSLEGSHAESNV